MSAFSNLGGLGVLIGSGFTPDELRKEIREARILGTKAVIVERESCSKRFCILEEKVDGVKKISSVKKVFFSGGDLIEKSSDYRHWCNCSKWNW